MIIETNRDFDFALSARTAEFTYESTERVAATIFVKDETLPVCVYRPDQQFHMEIYLPFRMKGEYAWKVYESLAQRPETAFRFWIDPLDGETKYCDYLIENTPEELDRAIERAKECIEEEWYTLKLFHQLADDGGNRSKNGADEDADREDGDHKGVKGFLELLQSCMREDD